MKRIIWNFAALSFLLANSAGSADAQVIVSGTSGTEAGYIIDHYQLGVYPALDTIMQGIVGINALNQAQNSQVFVSPLLKAVVYDYRFNLTTGEGVVTTRALDGSFLYTESGGPGTFSLHTSPPYPVALAPGEALPPYFIFGYNVPVTALEIGGSPVSPSLFPATLLGEILGFYVNPTTTNDMAANKWEYRINPNDPGLLPISWSSDNGSHLFVDTVDAGSSKSSSIGRYLAQVAENSAGVW